MAINFAIGSQEEVASWGPDAVYKIQKRARLQIMQVLQKRREPCTIEYPQNMYCWNQLDPDDIIRQPVNLGDFKTLLNLHSGLVQLEGLDQVTEGERQRQNAVKHLQMLRDVVAKNIRGRPIKCELCDLDCPTPQLLALHLETAKHKELEQQIMGPPGARSTR
ncbi:hypothetical protein DPMN_099958 [Dreissena polymorpha]|uniref:C2H2-type domain-containing protein n=2 Tax=Dreissena polymorpha TaxID=45954 RepID=A0A9D4LI92_DREPO|nr:hypothetical protein DPMN_099958 [Dreissena polymorpha]